MDGLRRCVPLPSDLLRKEFLPVDGQVEGLWQIDTRHCIAALLLLMHLFGNSAGQRGQILGLWWSDLTVLNASPANPEVISSADMSSHNSIVTSMRRCLLALKGEYMSQDGLSVNYAEMKSSHKFEQYVATASMLKQLDVTALSENERKAFFINIYNSLIVHALVEGFVKAGDGFTKRLKMYATAAYNIGGHTYSLNDIENGVLRGNRRSATPLSSIPFSNDDPRLSATVPLDPRIHFALNCGAKSCPPIAVYSPDKIDSQLDRAVQGALRDCTVNSKERSVMVSMLFKWYAEDFGTSDRAIMQWVAARAPADLRQAIQPLLEGQGAPRAVLKYHPYNWDINT